MKRTYTVYFLPKENYCGVTGRAIEKRLWEHRSYFNRDTTGVVVLATFYKKRAALDFEQKYQMKIELSKLDIGTVAKIVAEKAMQMHKKGIEWHRDGKYLSCVDMGKIANKVLKPTGTHYDFDSVFSGKKKTTSKKLNP